jgi:ubiquitin-protein ligase
MLEKDPEKRFNIKEVDKSITNINLKSFLKSKDIFEGIFFQFKIVCLNLI